MMSRQLWPVGQPLRGAGPQPGTQKPPARLQMRPESAAPQERSSDGPAQPQTPRSATQTGFTPPHRAALVALHSVQAPRSAPARWQAGRSGSGQLGAPSVMQATQVCVAIAQTGVTPPQWPSFRQATQTPTPDEVSQRGRDDGQCETSVAVQARRRRWAGRSAPPARIPHPTRRPDTRAPCRRTPASSRRTRRW